jgi:hypothetical protein
VNVARNVFHQSLPEISPTGRTPDLILPYIVFSLEAPQHQQHAQVIIDAVAVFFSFFNRHQFLEDVQ